MRMLLALALLVAAPAPPTVSGPRDTTSTRPTYVFHSRGAVAFRCAFDSARLHACKARYSQALRVGNHTLRVQALGRHRTRSRVTTLRVTVRTRVPALHVGSAVKVGNGPGAADAGFGAIWVPNTFDGTLSRYDISSGAVTAIQLGTPTPADANGYYDSAHVAYGSIWVASDYNGVVDRVAPDGTVQATLHVAARPLGIASGGGGVWVAHFLTSTLTRIDPATNAVRAMTVAGTQLVGVTYASSSLWVVSVAPARALRIDGDTGAVLQSLPLQAPYAARHSFIDAWWLASSGAASWATLPNEDAVARIDSGTAAVTYVQLPNGRPFGVAADEQAVYVSTDRGVAKIDTTLKGSVVGAAALPPADRTGFTGVTTLGGDAWVTNYDRGELYPVTP